MNRLSEEVPLREVKPPAREEPETVTGEAILRSVAFREIEQLLDGGFVGRIVLHCTEGGAIARYVTEETRVPGVARRRLRPLD